MRPAAIAVVGASSDPETIAGLLFSNLLASGYKGAIFPVNPRREHVQGVTAYPDLASCPQRPDLAVVCVPAQAVAGVVGEAAEVGTTAVCVISAGFAETGPEGAELQSEVVERAETGGVRLIGPNCTGIFANNAGIRFNATFSRTIPPPGTTSLLSQSGAFGVAVLEAAEARSLGIGAFVSIGNSADLSCNDLLSYWGEDPGTDLILLYLESIPEPQRFVRIAREVTARVPIVAIKAGRTEAGRRGASSHTAALSSGDAAVEAVLAQAGVIRADSLEEMLDVTTVLASRSRPRGRRVAVVTNGGGPGVLAADACESNGLVVPELHATTSGRLAALLPPQASVHNPVDMIASATARQYGEVARIVGSSGEVDSVLVLFNTPLITTASDVAAEIVAVSRELADTAALVGVFMNREGPPAELRAEGVAAFVYPENAARALAGALGGRRSAAEPAPSPVPPDITERARRLVATADLVDGWMTTAQAETLVGEYGVPTVRARAVSTEQEAADAQAELGGSVVVKLAAPVHKSDIGGVRLGARSPAEAAAAVRALRDDLERHGSVDLGDQLLVQEQIEAGLEMIVGLNRDPLLGPLVMVGLGGKLVELLEDVAVRLAPITREDAVEMVASLRCHRLLTGYRGSPPLDLAALQRVLLSVSALAEDLDAVAELDLNPVFVLEKGAVAADVRVRLTRPR